MPQRWQVQRRKPARKAVVAASIGNGLEWFDLVVYGTFAVTISRLFFPTENETASLLLAFASFGVSFIMRPLGAIVIGRYADKAGRKAGLMLSIGLMFIGTLLIAVAPTAATIGVAATIIIVLARLLQGFSTGGEFGTATAFHIEYAPVRKKAFYGSWHAATPGAAIMLAGLFGFVLNNYLSTQSLESWGWRIPFIFALAIGPVGWYIRSKMEETPEFLATETSKAPLKETFIGNSGPLWVIVGIVALASVAIYLALYMPTYAIVNLEMSTAAAFISTLIFGAVMAVGAPFVGNLADKVGPAKVMTWAAVGTLVVALPLFILLIIFPTQIRTTGMSLGYNISVTVFGGSAPFILTWLIATTGSLLAPSYYLFAIAAMSLASLIIARRVFSQR